MNPLRAGVIGLGWGQMHIDALKRVRNLEVVAVCDANAERAAQVGKHAGISRCFSRYEELLALDDIDLVTIATPPATHKEITLKAMFARKAVLLETPGGLTAQEAQALADTAQQRKIKNAVAFQTRYLPSYAYAKELIDEEYLGTFLRASITFVMAQPWGINGNWAADDGQGGGLIRNVAIHFIDALQWWLGPVESVMADRETLFSEVRRQVQVGRKLQTEKWTATAEDTFLSLLRFENGGAAILNFISGARHDAAWTIELVGSRGTLQITSGSLAGKRDTERDFGLIEIPRRLELPDRPREPLMWALNELAAGLAAQVRGDKALDRPPPTLRDAVQSHKVIAAIRRSADDMLWASV